MYSLFNLKVNMPTMSSKGYRSIILGGVIFNILTEIWVHGVIGFLNPVLAVSLLVLYTTYFLMLEDLVVRYRLRDIHVLIVGVIFGLWHETFTTGSTFKVDGLMGTDPFVLVVANVFWWGIMQSVMALYFANRYLGARDVQHRPLGKIGWGLCLLFSLSAVSKYMQYPDASLDAYVFVFILMVIMVALLRFTKKPAGHTVFSRSRFLDGLLVIHFVLCAGIGLTIGSMNNITSVTAFVVWSIIFSFLVVGYRIRRGSISV